MLEADRGAAVAEPFWRAERKAWAILLGAFATFCVLTTSLFYGGYRYLTTSNEPLVSASSVQPTILFRQRAGYIRPEIFDDGPIELGDRIIVNSDDQLGIGARLVVNGATVGLWRGTTVLVEARERGGPRLSLEAGQLVVYVPESGSSVFVASSMLPQEAELTAPGRYRLRTFTDASATTALSERGHVPGVELAVDRGTAYMGDTSVLAGSRLVSNGRLRSEPNRWLLLRDGDFTAYTAEEYRATLRGDTNTLQSTTWAVGQQAVVAGAVSQSGLLLIDQECVDGNPADTCRNVARLARLGGNTKDSTTSIAQEVAADVTAYSTVVLEADVRVDYQSLSKGGADGSECPLFARVLYADSRSRDLQLDFCFWAYDYGTGNLSVQPWIISQRIEPRTWYPFRADLKALIPNLREIQSVMFLSNGHDYDARVADVSLWAEGLAEVREQ